MFKFKMTKFWNLLYLVPNLAQKIILHWRKYFAHKCQTLALTFQNDIELGILLGGDATMPNWNANAEIQSTKNHFQCNAVVKC